MYLTWLVNISDLSCVYSTHLQQKNPIKIDGWNHHTKDKREGQRKVKKCAQLARTKEGRELVPLVIRSYLTHNPFNVTFIQIMRFNSNSRFRKASPANLFFYSIG